MGSIGAGFNANTLRLLSVAQLCTEKERQLSFCWRYGSFIILSLQYILSIGEIQYINWRNPAK